MNRLSSFLLAAAALVVAPMSAFAQDAPAPDGGGGDAAGAPATGTAPLSVPVAAGEAANSTGPYTKETWPTELVNRPLTLAKGQIELHVDALINLSKDAVFKPFAIAPDIYYGVSDKLSVGLTHALGLCLTGTDSGCAKVYNDVGLDALFSVSRDAKMDLAFDGGLTLYSLDPSEAGIHVGVRFKYVAGKLGIFADPSIGIGINKRDAGNKETLSIPIKVAYQASPKLAAFLLTGLGGLAPGTAFPFGAALLDPPAGGFGDFYGIPLGVGALFAVSNKIDIGGQFIFPLIAGSDFASSDSRVLDIFANLRF